MADADCGKADEKVSSDSKQCEEKESNTEHIFDCAYELVDPSGDNNDDPQCKIVDSFCSSWINRQADEVPLEQFKYDEYSRSSFYGDQQLYAHNFEYMNNDVILPDGTALPVNGRVNQAYHANDHNKYFCGP